MDLELERLTAKRNELTTRQDWLRDKAASTATEISAAEVEHKKIVDACAAEERTAIEAVEAMPNPAAEIESKMAEVKTAEARAAAHQRRRAAQEQVESQTAVLRDLRAKHERTEVMLETLRTLKKSLTADLPLGIPGLAVGDDGLTIDGVPFAQAATSTRIRVAVAIVMAQKPKARLIRMDDGEHLDKKHREQLLAAASERGFQVIMTRVADTEALEAEIVDADFPAEPLTDAATGLAATPQTVEAIALKEGRQVIDHAITSASPPVTEPLKKWLTAAEGGHFYSEHSAKKGAMLDCDYGCGCTQRVGLNEGKGPDGINPYGRCPKNPLNAGA